jgi:hypothetical protein
MKYYSLLLGMRPLQALGLWLSMQWNIDREIERRTQCRGADLGS